MKPTPITMIRAALRGQVARLVVAELLPHRDREGQPGTLLLELVHGLEGAFYLAHRQEDVPGLSASIRRKTARVIAGHRGSARKCYRQVLQIQGDELGAQAPLSGFLGPGRR